MESAWVDTTLDLNINPSHNTIKVLKRESSGKLADSDVKVPVKQETGALLEELNRISAENKKLTEMLTVLCERYSSLQNQYMELVSRNSGSDATAATSKKRKAECEDYATMIGFSGKAESSCSDEDSCKKPKDCIKAKISRAYVRTNPSDNSLIVRDGYQWRKYGQKVTRDNPSPRAYFKCSFAPRASVDVIPVVKHRPSPGSVYRSPQVYKKLKIYMNADNSSADAISTVWKNSYKGGQWRPCVNKSYEGLPESNGYIYVEANGGLNQQRTSICNAVAVAGYLNATLLIPNFHFHSIWRDPSKFKDIYDEEYFISTLKNDVRVVDKIPEYIMERFDHNLTNVYNFRIKAWSSIRYYRDVVLPKLLEEKVIRISPFANRLSFDAPPAVQRLRCLANYEALRFSSPILSLGETLVARMKERSANSGGKYLSVHLRFEEDMVAFSCCVFDGGELEKEDMKKARERGWKGKFTKPGRVIRPGAIRINGKCPLTPLEVGLMLRGMGFDNNTYIFLASGKIYNSEKTMAPLLEMFPNLQTKEMLASEEELVPYKRFSSRMAAIDYTVCLHSEVFLTTQGGNFPHFLMGHRRYLYGGHSKTIRPDKRRLALLFDNPNIGWRTFKRQMLNMRSHSDTKGFELKRPNDSIYTFPCPDCMCRTNKSEAARSSSAT